MSHKEHDQDDHGCEGCCGGCCAPFNKAKDAPKEKAPKNDCCEPAQDCCHPAQPCCTPPKP